MPDRPTTIDANIYATDYQRRVCIVEFSTNILSFSTYIITDREVFIKNASLLPESSRD